MRIRAIIPITACIILSGCCHKHLPTTVVTDSVRVEIHDRIVHDTATVEIPVIIEKNITRDTVSHLENTYAKSDALIRDGFLWHSLETIPQSIKAPITIHVTDTLYKESHVEEKIVEVEKKLSKWQTFCMKAFWWLAGAVVLLLLWTFRRFII